MTLMSVTDLPDFPFSSFAELVCAYERGEARVWTRYNFRAAGALWGELARAAWISHLLLVGSGFLCALGFAAALWRHDWRLLLGVPAGLIGFWFATPNPGCQSGCVPALLLIGGILAGAKRYHSAFPLEGCACGLCWLLTCAGFGVTDMMVRQQMVTSETAFLRFHARGVIVRVTREELPTPEENTDETVWPPPPHRPDERS